jgi:hypothetical protein
VRYCTQCGAAVTGHGRFCAVCGSQIAPAVESALRQVDETPSPSRAPTAVQTQTYEQRKDRDGPHDPPPPHPPPPPHGPPETIAASAPLAWHRNGNLALGFGVAALATSILWFVGLPLPTIGGVGALGVVILGWRARNTTTRRNGLLAIACAPVALTLSVLGIAIASSQGGTTTSPSSSAHFEVVNAQLVGPPFTTLPDGVVVAVCSPTTGCRFGGTLRNTSSVRGTASATFILLGYLHAAATQCSVVVPATEPGSTVEVGCTAPFAASPPGFLPATWPFEIKVVIG